MIGIKISDGERRIEESYCWSSSKRLEIAVFSDIHIPGDDLSDESVRIRENFNRVLADAKRFGPKLFIITGDLGQHEGCVKSYRWIKSTLEQTAVPYLLIPGNHDRGSLIEKVFPDFKLSFGKLYYYAVFGCWNFVFLDSSPDSVTNEQVLWLKGLLAKTPAHSVWSLVMHHPPIKCNCQYMDNHFPLMNNELLLELLDQSSQIKHIFCGHYHTSKQISYNSETVLHITPSTWFQIDEEETTFTISDHRIGYRRITIDGCSLRTEVVFLNPPD